MQAADFLRDSKTVAAVESQLLVAIVGDYADGECNMKPPPSDAEIARAYQVRLPVLALPACLARLQCDCASVCPPHAPLVHGTEHCTVPQLCAMPSIVTLLN